MEAFFGWSLVLSFKSDVVSKCKGKLYVTNNDRIALICKA